MTGVELIAAERARQIKKHGLTAAVDDQWTDGQLGHAAACYAAPPSSPIRVTYLGTAPDQWPSEIPCRWKPTPHDRIRELAKAGALIAAEIDRLQRVAEHEEHPHAR